MERASCFTGRRERLAKSQLLKTLEALYEEPVG